MKRNINRFFLGGVLGVALFQMPAHAECKLRAYLVNGSPLISDKLEFYQNLMSMNRNLNDLNSNPFCTEMFATNGESVDLKIENLKNLAEDCERIAKAYPNIPLDCSMKGVLRYLSATGGRPARLDVLNEVLENEAPPKNKPITESGSEPHLFYFGDHGNRNESESTISLGDGSELNSSQLSALIERSHDLNPRSPTVMVFDTCFSGGMLGAQYYNGDLKGNRIPNTCGFAASQQTEVAFGTYSFGGELERVLNEKDPCVLKKIDGNQDGKLSFSEVFHQMEKLPERCLNHSFCSNPVSTSDLFVSKYTQTNLKELQGRLGFSKAVEYCQPNAPLNEINQVVVESQRLLLGTHLKALEEEVVPEFPGLKKKFNRQEILKSLSELEKNKLEKEKASEKALNKALALTNEQFSKVIPMISGLLETEFFGNEVGMTLDEVQKKMGEINFSISKSNDVQFIQKLINRRAPYDDYMIRFSEVLSQVKDLQFDPRKIKAANLGFDSKQLDLMIPMNPEDLKYVNEEPSAHYRQSYNDYWQEKKLKRALVILHLLEKKDNEAMATYLDLIQCENIIVANLPKVAGTCGK